jgi:hypothetical protein
VAHPLKRFFARRRGALRRFGHSQWVYFAHIAGVLLPGEELPQHRAHPTSAQPLDNWPTEDLSLMIDEGRRQLDRQLSDLERIRGRAQWLFTVGAAITTALAGGFVAEGSHGWLFVLWILGLALLVIGVGGAAAVMTVRADFKTIDTAVLSGYKPPAQSALARDYSRMLRLGEDTVATRLTIFRQAVLYVILGGYTGLLALLLD